MFWSLSYKQSEKIRAHKGFIQAICVLKNGSHKSQNKKLVTCKIWRLNYSKTTTKSFGWDFLTTNTQEQHSTYLRNTENWPSVKHTTINLICQQMSLKILQSNLCRTITLRWKWLSLLTCGRCSCFNIFFFELAVIYAYNYLLYES